MEGWQAIFIETKVATLCTFSFQNYVLLFCTTHHSPFNKVTFINIQKCIKQIEINKIKECFIDIHPNQSRLYYVLFLYKGISLLLNFSKPTDIWGYFKMVCCISISAVRTTIFPTLFGSSLYY